MPPLPVILAFSFGVVFMTALLILAVLIPSPTPQQFEIFRIVISVAVAGFAAVIPGLVHAKLRRGKGLAVTASGAMAVLFIVYFYSPARWVSADPDNMAARQGGQTFQNSGNNFGQQNNGGTGNVYNNSGGR